MDSEFILTVIGSAIVGYCGGWLFSADSQLKGAMGLYWLSCRIFYPARRTHCYWWEAKLVFHWCPTRWAFSIGSLSNMDNWHLFIIMSLIAFGSGHAVFRVKIGFWTFLLLITFLVPLLFIYQEGEMYIVILVNVVLGFLFAHRQVIIDIVDDVRDGLGQFLVSLVD